MRLNRLVAVAIAVGFGAALATGPAAVADAIDDAWPYGGLASPGVPPALPGFVDPGSVIGGNNQIGPFVTSYADYVVTHTHGGTDDWYSAHSNTFIVPNFYQDDQEAVKALLDSSAAYPSAGTLFDHSILFPIYNPAFGTINLFENTYLYDPKLGFADQFSVPGMSNTFLIDVAGMKDVASGFGNSFTLFELPFSVAPDAGAASDAGDGFSQLLAELAGGG